MPTAGQVSLRREIPISRIKEQDLRELVDILDEVLEFARAPLRDSIGSLSHRIESEVVAPDYALKQWRDDLAVANANLRAITPQISVTTYDDPDPVVFHRWVDVLEMVDKSAVRGISLRAGEYSSKVRVRLDLVLPEKGRAYQGDNELNIEGADVPAYYAFGKITHLLDRRRAGMRRWLAHSSRAWGWLSFITPFVLVGMAVAAAAVAAPSYVALVAALGSISALVLGFWLSMLASALGPRQWPYIEVPGWGRHAAARQRRMYRFTFFSLAVGILGLVVAAVFGIIALHNSH